MAIFVMMLTKKHSSIGVIWALIICFSFCFPLVLSAQEGTKWNEQGHSERMSNPGRTLDEPFTAPIFLGAHLAIGGAAKYDQGNTGYGAEFIIRPGAAGKYLDFLYRHNTGLVFQADYMNIGLERKILSADFILRKYFSDMRGPKTTGSTFVGAGFGASAVYLAPPDGTSLDKYWSGVVEAGQELIFKEKYLLYAKVQYRYYNFHKINYSNWSIMLGAGIPLPW